MRLTYLDEAGTAQHEPYFVVAAIIIEADKQLVAVERHLDEITVKHIPAEDRPGFVFLPLQNGSRPSLARAGAFVV